MNRNPRLFALIFTSAIMVLSGEIVRSAEPASPRLRAARKLVAAITQADAEADEDRRVAILREAGRQTVRTVSRDSVVAESIDALAASRFTNARQAAGKWKAELVEARKLLRFEPLLEASSPEGYPAPTPAGEVQLQEYPAYRMALTEMQFIKGQSFWRLFNHIKKAEIAMTAPVEITFAEEGGKLSRKAKMAFLYQRTQQGTPGASGDITVREVPKQSAISFGVCGRVTKERPGDERRRLASWLEAHAAEYDVAGPLRVMEYNSPFVSDAKRFCEVQIPVQAKPPTTADWIPGCRG